MPNTDLLIRTYAYIRSHPEEHFQESWREVCGTKFCFAGHAALLSGHRLAIPTPPAVAKKAAEVEFELLSQSEQERVMRWETWLDFVLPRKDIDYEGSSIQEMPALRGPSTKPVISMSAAAQAALGLTSRQALSLFNAYNTMSDIRDMIAGWTGLSEATVNRRAGAVIRAEGW